MISIIHKSHYFLIHRCVIIVLKKITVFFFLIYNFHIDDNWSNSMCECHGFIYFVIDLEYISLSVVFSQNALPALQLSSYWPAGFFNQSLKILSAIASTQCLVTQTELSLVFVTAVLYVIVRYTGSWYNDNTMLFDVGWLNRLFIP